MEKRVQLKHPLGKKLSSIASDKYDVLKKAILTSLKNNRELTHTELDRAVKDVLKKDKTKFEGSISWYMESVKLDLEANRIVERVHDTKPQTYRLVKKR